MNSKYENLLKYLEKHETVAAKPEKPKKILEPKEEKKPDKKESQRSRINKITKEMIEETEVFSYVPAHVKKKYPTEGFNVRLLEEKFVKKMIEDHKRIQSYERPYISVTEILNCLRSCYYFRKKYSINIKSKFNYPFLYIRRKVGDSVHEAIQDVYNFDETEKTVISEKFPVKGRLDGLIDSYVIDFKPSDKMKDEVDPKHYDQGNIYATILNTEYGYSIEKVIIVYYILNFKDMQVFVDKVDLKRGLGFLNRGKLLKEHLDNNTLIDPIGATEKECRYCSYIKYCEKDQYKKVAPPKVKNVINKSENKIDDVKPKKKPKKKIEKQKLRKNSKFEYKDPDGFLL